MELEALASDLLMLLLKIQMKQEYIRVISNYKTYHKQLQAISFEAKNWHKQ
jgi:hypothetical protein